MNPRVVVFDLGKVLVDFDYGLAVKRLAQKCSVPPQKVRAALDQSPLLFEYETGSIDKKTFFNKVCAATGYCGDIQEFAPCFGDIFTPIPEMVELHSALKKAGYPTYIFSNTNEIAVDHVRCAFPFFSGFTGYIYSYEHGAMKPDPRLYAAVERISEAKGPEILYLDDRVENVEEGQRRRWQVIHHSTPEQSRKQIEALGML